MTETGNHLAELYVEAGERLNLFFREWTGAACADCLAFYRRESPLDPIAGHELAGGIFPGCCQAGVADDMNIPDGNGKRLPGSLISAILAARTRAEENQDCEYRVRELSTGMIHTGKGCKWMDRSGCVLGPLKSPICLSYLCQPLREKLSRFAGGAAWPLEEDCFGFFAFLHTLRACESNGEVELPAARSALARFLALVDRRDLALSQAARSDRGS